MRRERGDLDGERAVAGVRDERGRVMAEAVDAVVVVGPAGGGDVGERASGRAAAREARVAVAAAVVVEEIVDLAVPRRVADVPVRPARWPRARLRRHPRVTVAIEVLAE